LFHKPFSQITASRRDDRIVPGLSASSARHSPSGVDREWFGQCLTGELGGLLAGLERGFGCDSKILALFNHPLGVGPVGFRRIHEIEPDVHGFLAVPHLEAVAVIARILDVGAILEGHPGFGLLGGGRTFWGGLGGG